MQQKDVPMPSQTKAIIVMEVFAMYLTSVGIAFAEPEPSGADSAGGAVVDSPIDPPDEDTRNAASLEAYRDQRYSDAMRGYQALWDDFGKVKYLYNAAISHEVLGHDAQAYVYFRRCQVHTELTADMLVEIDERLNALRRRTVLLRVQSTTDLRAPGARVELRYRSLQGLTDPERTPLSLRDDITSFLDERGELVVYVERGLWGASVVEPGRKIESGTIEITDTSAKTAVLAVSMPHVPIAKDREIDLTVDPDTHENVRRWMLERSNRRLTLGLGTVSALIFAGGTIMTVYSAVRWSEEIDEFLRMKEFTTRDSARKQTEEFLRFQVAGAVLGGGGIGLGVTSLISMRPRRTRVWAAPIVLGAGSLAVGVFGAFQSYDSLVREGRDRAESGMVAEGERSSFHEKQAVLLLVSTAMGSGAGMMVGGVVGIIHAAASRRRTASRVSLVPQVSTTGASLVLRGQF